MAISLRRFKSSLARRGREVRGLVSFLTDTFREYQKDHPDLLGAGLGYFALFSIPPVLIILSAIVGHIWAHQATKNQLIDKLGEIIGGDAAESVQHFLNASSGTGKGKATLFSLAVLYVAGSRIFAHLRTAMDIIWDIAPVEESFFKGLIRAWLMNLAMLLALAIFILAFFVLDALMGLFKHLAGPLLPLLDRFYVLQTANVLLPFLLFTVLFASAYRYVPDTGVTWKDAWPGALLTSALFAIGKSAIALYVGYQSFTSVYGAASSVVIIMVWIYFASQIFFFGAEFTWLYANRFGSRAPSRLKS